MIQNLKKIFFTSSALLSMTLVAQGVQAQPTTVCADGCDFTSIQDGIDAARDWEEVIVSPGTYNENIIFPPNYDIRLRSSGGPENTIIDGSTNPGQPVVSILRSGLAYNQALTGFTITNGNAPEGGGIFVSGLSIQIAITDCIITGNNAGNGGGVYIDEDAFSYFTDSVITNNTADVSGGGIFNGAVSSGGYSYSTFTNCEITNNTAYISGGGIFNIGGVIEFNDGVISNNSATTGDGGGVNIYGMAEATFKKSIVSGNSAGTNGGGIDSSGYNTVLENSIINGNIAATWGGGIAISSEYDYVQLNHCTISGNSAGAGGGGIGVVVTMSPYVQALGANNVLWSNSPDQISAPFEAVILEYSDIQDGWHDTNGTNINCDPQFVTQDDFHLTSTSCCIDAGASNVFSIIEQTPFVDDIEGNLRPSGLGYDIGAYELTTVPLCDDLDGDGMTDCAGDCNDNDPSIYFGAAEICDGLDNNCDGTVPVNETDVDNDGFMGCQECNDANQFVYPGAAEVCNNGIDDDCDGSADCADGECLDFCAQPQPEICYDGIDNDLDGLTDCADKRDCRKDPACGRSAVDEPAPNEPENCTDGIDNDGDGKTDCADKGDCRKDPACK